MSVARNVASAVVLVVALLVSASPVPAATVSGSALLVDSTGHGGTTVTLVARTVAVPGLLGVGGLLCLLAAGCLVRVARRRRSRALVMALALLLASAALAAAALTTATSDTGQYSFAAVADGRYDLVYEHDGYVTATVTSIKVEGSDVTVGDVVLDRLLLRVTPGSAALAVGGTESFAAALNDPETELAGGVSWTVEAVGSGAPGTIDGTGRYTAPSTLPEPPLARIVATAAVADLTLRADVLVELRATGAA
ncbi:MAG: carboxypeptidase regulatory-like domain-containing protein [Candidatus Schekmanbacteria bacterium]|nr:carboxypeptidase regulatory-like domain-containing protein [Candidatus Schekmanbacteria bacterium]